jgi:hypothetical protein
MSQSAMSPLEVTLQVARTFATHLARGAFADAHALLTTALAGQFSPSDLEREYAAMLAYLDDATADHVEVITMLDQWPGAQPDDLGWAYVAIAGEDWSEGVSVVVCREGDPRVRAVEWGRP